MPRLCQNDRERAVGMVQDGMTHQAAADHFNFSRLTISRLMIRLRQTVRTNDRPRNGRSRMTSQRQDNHLRLIQLWNRMITDEDTTRRTFGLTNVRILGQTVQRRLRQYGLRTRRSVVGPILKKRHMTAMDVIVCTAGERNILRTSVCTNPIVLEAEVLVWAGICHDGRTQLKIVQGTMNAIKCRQYS